MSIGKRRTKVVDGGGGTQDTKHAFAGGRPRRRKSESPICTSDYATWTAIGSWGHSCCLLVFVMREMMVTALMRPAELSARGWKKQETYSSAKATENTACRARRRRDQTRQAVWRDSDYRALQSAAIPEYVTRATSTTRTYCWPAKRLNIRPEKSYASLAFFFSLFSFRAKRADLQFRGNHIWFNYARARRKQTRADCGEPVLRGRSSLFVME